MEAIADLALYNTKRESESLGGLKTCQASLLLEFLVRVLCQVVVSVHVGKSPLAPDPPKSFGNRPCKFEKKFYFRISL